MSKIAKLEIITDLRSVWKHEERGFSKWLIQDENLDILADELKISIIEPESEVSVGPFSVDIKAETEEGKTVIIENQLEKTDHDHLGKIITYASGLEAEYIIWLVREAREEHRKAVDWLNENTNEDINFFLLEVKLYKIGDSLPAPKFEIVANPNNWSKSVKAVQKNSLAPRHTKRIDFWQKFIDYSSVFSNRKPTKNHWFIASIGSSKYYISLLTSKQNPKGAAVEFTIKTDEGYELLLENESQIKSLISDDIYFNQKSKGGQVVIQTTKSIVDDESHWDEIFDFYIEYYNKFKETLPKYV